MSHDTPSCSVDVIEDGYDRGFSLDLFGAVPLDFPPRHEVSTPPRPQRDLALVSAVFDHLYLVAVKADDGTGRRIGLHFSSSDWKERALKLT